MDVRLSFIKLRISFQAKKEKNKEKNHIKLQKIRLFLFKIATDFL